MCQLSVTNRSSAVGYGFAECTCGYAVVRRSQKRWFYPRTANVLLTELNEIMP